jgi:hypothetical protein
MPREGWRGIEFVDEGILLGVVIKKLNEVIDKLNDL